MKPFATLGSEIGKVRDRVRRRAEALHPSHLGPLVREGVRDQRDRLLAKLGEQTFRLIAERKLAVPRVLQESVERLAALLGVQLPQPGEDSAADRGESEVAGLREAVHDQPREAAAEPTPAPPAAEPPPVEKPHARKAKPARKPRKGR